STAASSGSVAPGGARICARADVSSRPTVSRFLNHGNGRMLIVAPSVSRSERVVLLYVLACSGRVVAHPALSGLAVTRPGRPRNALSSIPCAASPPTGTRRSLRAYEDVMLRSNQSLGASVKFARSDLRSL